RAALIHLERYFADNAATARGQWAHDTVDQTGPSTTPDGTRRWNSLPVWDSSLGIHGICDVVEFHPEGPFRLSTNPEATGPVAPPISRSPPRCCAYAACFPPPCPTEWSSPAPTGAATRYPSTPHSRLTCARP